MRSLFSQAIQGKMKKKLEEEQLETDNQYMNLMNNKNKDFSFKQKRSSQAYSAMLDTKMMKMIEAEDSIDEPEAE